MSWTDKEIDKLFQKEAAKQTFEYNDAYWKEMEAMLPASKKGDYLWFLTSGIFIALLFVTPFMGVLNEGKSAEVKAMEENSIEPIQIAENSINSNKVVKNSNKINGLDGSLTEIKMNNSKTENHSVDDQNNSQVSENKDATPNHFKKENVTPFVAKQNSTISSVLAIVNEEVITENDQVRVQVESDASLRENASLLNVNKEELFPEAGDVDDLELHDVALLNTRSPLDLQSISYDLSLPWSTSFYVEANAGLGQSLITPSVNNSHYLGAGVGTQFRKGRIVFTTGANFIWSHHKDLQLTRQAKIYGFGSEVVQSHINYSELYRIEANLNVGYSFGRHNLNIGIRPSYLVGTKVKVTQDEGLEGGNRTVYGFTEGINRWGLKPSFGYGFDISRNLTLGVNVSTQVLTSVNEDFINGVNNKFPIDGQIYLRKTLRLRK